MPRDFLNCNTSLCRYSVAIVLFGALLTSAWNSVSLVCAQGPVTATADESRLTTQDTSSEKLPPPLKRYKGRKIAPVMSYAGADWLIRSERIQEENPQKMLNSLNVKPGQTVCDLGCGNGYYTLELARRVGPDGKVLAVDIQPEMLRLLEHRAGLNGLDNVELILNTPIDPKLPDNSVDLILLVDVYHEFSHPEHMLKAMRKSLKPDGRIVLVEFRGEDPTVPILPLHKMTKEQVRNELEPNGFKLVEQYDELPWQHVMFFGKASDEETAAAIRAEEERDAAAKERASQRAERARQRAKAKAETQPTP